MLLSLLLFFTLCIAALLLWVPFTFEIEVVREEDQAYAAVHWRVLGLAVSLTPIIRAVGRTVEAQFRAMLPQSVVSDPRLAAARLRELTAHVTNRGKRMRIMMGLAVQEILSLNLQMVLGLADPFLTAAACGCAWAALAPLVVALEAKSLLLSYPRISITPSYQRAALEIRFHCIFRFRLGQIIRDMVRTFASSMAQRIHKGVVR